MSRKGVVSFDLGSIWDKECSSTTQLEWWPLISASSLIDKWRHYKEPPRPWYFGEFNSWQEARSRGHCCTSERLQSWPCAVRLDDSRTDDFVASPRLPSGWRLTETNGRYPHTHGWSPWVRGRRLPLPDNLAMHPPTGTSRREMDLLAADARWYHILTDWKKKNKTPGWGAVSSGDRHVIRGLFLLFFYDSFCTEGIGISVIKKTRWSQGIQITGQYANLL